MCWGNMWTAHGRRPRSPPPPSLPPSCLLSAARASDGGTVVRRRRGKLLATSARRKRRRSGDGGLRGVRGLRGAAGGASVISSGFFGALDSHRSGSPASAPRALACSSSSSGSAASNNSVLRVGVGGVAGCVAKTVVAPMERARLLAGLGARYVCTAVLTRARGAHVLSAKRAPVLGAPD